MVSKLTMKWHKPFSFYFKKWGDILICSSFEGYSHIWPYLRRRTKSPWSRGSESVVFRHANWFILSLKRLALPMFGKIDFRISMPSYYLWPSTCFLTFSFICHIQPKDLLANWCLTIEVMGCRAKKKKLGSKIIWFDEDRKTPWASKPMDQKRNIPRKNISHKYYYYRQRKD